MSGGGTIDLAVQKRGLLTSAVVVMGGGGGGVVCEYVSATVMFLPARADRSSDDNFQTNEEPVEAAIASRRAKE